MRDHEEETAIVRRVDDNGKCLTCGKPMTWHRDGCLMHPIEIKENIDRFREKMAELPTPKWILEMNEHYYRTGCVRSKDLYRVLGDQTRGVSPLRIENGKIISSLKFTKSL